MSNVLSLLHHDLFPVDDIDTLAGIRHELTGQVVDLVGLFRGVAQGLDTCNGHWDWRGRCPRLPGCTIGAR